MDDVGGLKLEFYTNEAGGNGDQVLNSMSRDVIPMLESWSIKTESSPFLTSLMQRRPMRRS